MTNNTETLLQTIVESIQELKGKKIVTVNLTKLPERSCDYFVIAEGNSTTHVSAIADSVLDYVRKNAKTKPFATDGWENALWIAFDYGQILVHIFEPETRAFYNIEHLWEDAELEEIPDLN